MSEKKCRPKNGRRKNSAWVLNFRAAFGLGLTLAFLFGSSGAVFAQASASDGPALPLIGKIRPRSAKEIASSTWSIGGETLDRDFAVYANYRTFLGPLGAKRIRLQAGWAKCEKKPGIYDWAWLDAVVNDTLAQGVQPWLEPSYGNTLYSGGGGTGLGGGLPKSPEALAAWDNWVRALVRRYQDRVQEWEVWNEPDLGRDAPAELYAEFFIRTAEIIRAEAPGARVWALGLAGNLAYADQFLAQMQQKGKTSLIDAITVHGYPRNPDDTSIVDKMRALLAKYGLAVPVRQGETGAPSKLQEYFALSKIPWTENTQAKWNLRRMLAHHGKDVPFNLFTISDLHYRGNGQLRMNYKGLLGTNPDQTTSHAKPAYFAAQNVFAIFDDSLARVTNFTCTASVTNSIAAFAYADKSSGAQLVALWFKGAAPAAGIQKTSKIRISAFGNEQGSAMRAIAGSIKVGPAVAENVPVAIMPIPAIFGADGLRGLSFLSQFTFRLDYQQKLVSLAPPASSNLTANGTGIPLQKQGRLLAINGVPVQSLKFAEIKRAFQAEPGTRIRLRLQAHGAPLREVALTLRDLL
jgi:hypothetical protein